MLAGFELLAARFKQMDFELTEEQLQMKMSVREFAEGEIAPHVMEWDETQHFPTELQPKLAELGLLGILFPEEYGGAGLGYVEYATAIEELSRVDGSVGISVAAHNSLCSNHVYQYGSEAQKQKYLAPLARGEHLGAWGLTEPGAGSDASGTRTTAVRKDGGWVVNGSKNFITHAIHADTCVAFASTDRTKQSKGISAFIFEKGMKGFAPSKKENKLGLRASETASVVFEDCFVPDDNRLGEEGQGFVNAMQILDGGRISIAALAVGIAQGAFESAVRYSGERQQFGKPIRGKRTTRESSMAKLFASEISVRVCEEAIQIHGGYGYTKDYPAEKYWRDSKLCTIGEGTSEIQRIIIAREILKQV